MLLLFFALGNITRVGVNGGNDKTADEDAVPCLCPLCRAQLKGLSLCLSPGEPATGTCR